MSAEQKRAEKSMSILKTIGSSFSNKTRSFLPKIVISAAASFSPGNRRTMKTALNIYHIFV